METKTILRLGIIAAIAVLLILELLFIASRSTLFMAEEEHVSSNSLKNPPYTLGDVDRILRRTQFGNIAFNTPTSMNLYSNAVIQLLLGVETPIEELKKLVEAAGEKAGERVRISNRMEARLSGANFAITAITPETQAVSRTEVTEWKWEIKPKSTGRQYLHLTLSVILSVEGTPTLKTIRTFDKIIEVEVSWNQIVKGFIGKNWQWLWAAILVPIIGGLWRWKSLRAKKGIIDK